METIRTKISNRAKRFLGIQNNAPRTDLHSLDRAAKEHVLTFSTAYVYGARVPGDIVEFGTMSGMTARHLAEAMLKCERDYQLPPRRLHMFDSFEGLPHSDASADIDSPHVQDGTWGVGTCKVLSEQGLREVCRAVLPEERFSIYKGWFSATVAPINKNLKFALLHVDCDLYQSTVDALRPLLERGQISKGAIILFDDWNCNSASNSFGERRAWEDLSAEFKIVAESLGSYSWSGHRFIVHDYKF
jgi:hypothetical protein